MIQKAAVIHDLSGLGKCSLTAAIPILSCLGIQPCPIPTAVLTNQTGYSSYHMKDFTDEIEHYIHQWNLHQPHFQGIFTGFLGSERQISILLELVSEFRREDTTLIVDPVMGDDGVLYKCYDPAFCEAMKTLAFHADLVTPNLTEACLLTDTDYNTIMAASGDPDFHQLVFKLGEQLQEKGIRNVVITGVPCGRDDMICNLVLDGKRRANVKNRRYGGSYSGTGDIFSSILCGGMLNGYSLIETVQTACSIIENAMKVTFKAGTDRNEGILFEPYLPMLWKSLGMRN